MKLWIATFVLLMGSCPRGKATVEHSIRLLYYNFTTCNAYGRFGPTVAECRAHYENQSSPIASRLMENAGDVRGVQYFVVPQGGRYVVTAAGARGGKGVCTRWPGLSPVAQLTVVLEKDTVLEVAVGQMGRDACDNNVNDIALCDMTISNIEEAVRCSMQWETMVPWLVNNYDGGGGGGGGTLVRHTGIGIPPMIVVGGGGGESSHFPNITEEEDLQRVEEKNGQNKTQGTGLPGTRPVNEGLLTAGRGSGNVLLLRDGATAIDGKSLSTHNPEFAQGGRDCYIRFSSKPYFPDTYGGFGGGGGGCGNGPGGGGYEGGSVQNASNSQNGEGGFLYPSVVQILGYNSGHGFVSLRLEDCGCAQNCSIDFEKSVFTCTCPENTVLSPDGFDCHVERDLNFTNTSSLGPLSTFSEDYGQIALTPLVLDGSHSVNVIGLSLSMSATVTPVSKGTWCGLILTDSSGNIVAVVQVGPADSSLIQRVTSMDSCCGKVNFTIENPVLLLNGSVEVVGGYIYHTEGSSCDIVDARANVSIREGMQKACCTALNSSQLPAFFSHLSDLNNLGLPTTSPEEYPWLIVGAMVGAAIVLLVLLLPFLVAHVIVKCKHVRENTSADQDQNYPYDYVEPNELAVDDDVAIETNPAYLPGVHVDSYTTNCSNDLSYV